MPERRARGAPAGGADARAKTRSKSAIVIGLDPESDNFVGPSRCPDNCVEERAESQVAPLRNPDKNVAHLMKGDKNVRDAGRHAREVRRLSTLLDVSQALSGTLNLKSALHRVLEILASHHGAVRGVVSLVQADGHLRVEASDGFGDASRVRYEMGEGITGRVVQSGKPVVVPRVSREPAFLHRASSRPELAHQELSFVCVPIVVNRRAAGALAIDLKFNADRDFERTVKFLGVVASMIAQAIKVHRLIDEDKRK